MNPPTRTAYARHLLNVYLPHGTHDTLYMPRLGGGWAYFRRTGISGMACGPVVQMDVGGYVCLPMYAGEGNAVLYMADETSTSKDDVHLCHDYHTADGQGVRVVELPDWEGWALETRRANGEWAAEVVFPYPDEDHDLPFDVARSEAMLELKRRRDIFMIWEQINDPDPGERAEEEFRPKPEIQDECWLAWEAVAPILGSLPDRAIAERVGVTPARVCQVRTELNAPAYDRWRATRHEQIDWTQVDLSRTPTELARELGVSRSLIYFRRAKQEASA